MKEEAAMNSTTDTHQSAPVVFATPRIDERTQRLIRAADDLWRVVGDTGRVIGHLQALIHPLGLRYRARRYHPAIGRFLDLGDFWSADEAIEALR
jgi:hypothetical protein